MTCEPLAGWRHVAVTERRTMEDFGQMPGWRMLLTRKRRRSEWCWTT